MPKTVLIARPHTFIVSVMKPFLEECGHGTHRLEYISDLPCLSATAAAQLGRQETFLYFSKDDLTSPERHAIATRLVQRHFQQKSHG